MTATVTPLQLAGLCSGSKKLAVDVHTPVEFREVHIATARVVPLDLLDPPAVMQARSGRSDEPIYVTCCSETRGQQAAEKFTKAGRSQWWGLDSTGSSTRRSWERD